MILRTYMCDQCAYRMEVELRADQWDQVAPDCPRCSGVTYQEFKPPTIGGSPQARAAALVEDIARNEYHVADMQADNRQGGVPKVRYNDVTAPVPTSTWGSANQEMLEGAIALGKQSRLRYGSGLDVLQHNLKTGAQPDLIEISKRRSLRVF